MSSLKLASLQPMTLDHHVYAFSWGIMQCDQAEEHVNTVKQSNGPPPNPVACKARQA